MPSSRRKIRKVEDDIDFDWGASGLPDANKSPAKSATPEAEPNVQADRSGSPRKGTPTELEREVEEREREDWFDRLPEDEKERLRARSRWEAERFIGWEAWRRRLRFTTVVQGALILGVVQWLQFGSSGFAIGLAFGLGAGLGLFWDHTAAGRILRMLTAIPLYFALQVFASGRVQASMGNPTPAMFLVYGGLVVAIAAAATGIIRERHERDGPSG